jgi:hypothetical protein
MEIGISHRNNIKYIGPSEILTALFTTIWANLEANGWGTRYPVLMKKFYQGELRSEDAEVALKELGQIRGQLSAAHPSQIVWDPDDLRKPAPRGTSVSSTAPSIAEAFLTPTGHNLFDTITTALEELREYGGTAKIVRIPTEFDFTIDGAK